MMFECEWGPMKERNRYGGVEALDAPLEADNG